jgi:hypothetical protein
MSQPCADHHNEEVCKVPIEGGNAVDYLQQIKFGYYNFINDLMESMLVICYANDDTKAEQ